MITTRQTRFAVLLIFALTLAPLGALAAPGQQQPEPEQQPLETRVFEVQHAGELDLRPILNMFGVRWSFDSRLKTLIVRAPGEIMPAIEQVVRRFDVAAPATPSVELTTFILVATNDGPQQALPPQLDPVVEQLRGVLPYRVFNALDSAIARGVDREVISVQGVMPQVPGAAPGNPDYSLRAGLIVTAESGDRRMVRLDNFQFHTEIRLPDQVHDVSIGTSIDIYEGQHAVVGKASVGDSALILIMSARIIN